MTIGMFIAKRTRNIIDELRPSGFGFEKWVESQAQHTCLRPVTYVTFVQRNLQDIIDIMDTKYTEVAPRQFELSQSAKDEINEWIREKASRCQ